ncbi:MAG TPA: DUF3592 domain-containing protein [Xanthobacteraceae bacterium]|nr:DUF3592 domain-containing protein [Xanthobacteraceae bacterium]
MALKWFLLAILMAFDALFLAAVIAKYRESARASRWIPATGTIKSSSAQARRVARTSASGRAAIKDSELRNFAVIRYEFRANGRTVSGTRIGIADDLGNYQVAEKLKRYPVGAAVTVFHDRERPESCVLERDMPARGLEIAILGGALVAVCGVIFVLVSGGFVSGLSRLVPHADQAPAAMFVAVLGLFVSWFGVGLYRRGAATHAWPSTTGTIASSAAEGVAIRFSFNTFRDNSVGRVFRQRTVYTYCVAGVTYRSDTTSFGAQSYASFRLLAERGAARFQPGQPVEVFYNPAIPEQAVLTRGAPGQSLVWLVALGLFGLAARLAGLA